VELGNSIQKCILRVYIMKYSNIGTMNASSIRWSTVASKLERSRPSCNLLDALALQLCYSMPFLRQNSLASYNHHSSQQPTLSLSAPGCASTSPPCMCWEKWHEQRMDAQRISHVWEMSHLNATSKSQASNKQDPFSLLSTNLVRQQ
jgi:hypothetical protein